MADVGINPGAWTDPRMMLANQLMQQSAETTPLQSWTQVLARALSGPLGAYEATKVRDDRNQALTDVYGGGPIGAGQPGAQPTGGQQSPGLFQRIGNFFTGDNSQSQSAPAGGGAGAAGSSGQTSGAPAGSTQPQQSGVIQASYPSGGGTSGAPTPVPVQAQADQTTPAQAQSFRPATALAQQVYTAQRMMQVGRERNQPDLVMQGATMLQSIQQEVAKSQLSAMAQGHNIDPFANNGSGMYSNMPGYDQAMAATEGAKSRATELGKLDPSVTQGKVAQTNAVNVGTMGSEAAMSGAKAQADANAKNASELAYAPAIVTAKDQAAADVALKNKPTLDAATTAAVNNANAGKPLTPKDRADLEQSQSKSFQDLPVVREHIQTSQAYRNVLSAANGTTLASDINLIDALAKMFNPGAIVRQGAYDTFQEHSQGIPENIKGIATSVINGARIQPEARAQLLQEAQNRMDASRQAYAPYATFATQQAQAQGLNPSNVLPNVVDPLTAREELARRAAARAAQAQPTQAQPQ